MGVDISYMGTKRELICPVSQVAAQAQDGPLLDLFSGMCSVAEAVAPKRQVWTNDVQLFAAEVGAALFTGEQSPPSPTYISDLSYELFSAYCGDLEGKFSASLEIEDKIVNCDNFEKLISFQRNLDLSLERERIGLGRQSYCMFVKNYSNAYFGVRQAIQIDSIRRTIDLFSRSGRFSLDIRRWLLIALGRTLLRVANSTGHFAQFLTPKSTSYRKFIRQRRRSVWIEYLAAVDQMSIVGTPVWRAKNKAFNEDALKLLPRLHAEVPSVIYADPPYTTDQYSRYYHLLDTLLLYDYPSTHGAGLYRAGRFQTSFALKSKCALSFEELVASVAKLGADLVLSYPTNGVLTQIGGNLQDMLRKYFKKVECCFSLQHKHSTFGASKGSVKAEVTEKIYLASA